VPAMADLQEMARSMRGDEIVDDALRPRLA
jgi:hypothetical protein